MANNVYIYNSHSSCMCWQITTTSQKMFCRRAADRQQRPDQLRGVPWTISFVWYVNTSTWLCRSISWRQQCWCRSSTTDYLCGTTTTQRSVLKSTMRKWMLGRYETLPTETTTPFVFSASNFYWRCAPQPTNFMKQGFEWSATLLLISIFNMYWFIMVTQMLCLLTAS